MTPPRVLPLIGALGATVLAGCGGGSRTSLTAKRYDLRATAICTRDQLHNSEIGAKLISPAVIQHPDRLAPVATAIASDTEREVRDLGSLSPPRRLASSVHRALGLTAREPSLWRTVARDLAHEKNLHQLSGDRTAQRLELVASEAQVAWATAGVDSECAPAP